MKMSFGNFVSCCVEEANRKKDSVIDRIGQKKKDRQTDEELDREVFQNENKTYIKHRQVILSKGSNAKEPHTRN